MKRINVVYIDDNLDLEISRFLEGYRSSEVEIKYEEISFSDYNGYNDLINDVRVKEADVIIIDSRLFENDNVTTDKFTGEELGIILKKFFPFKEVLVVTQNLIERDFGAISKYRGDFGGCAQTYYADNLGGELEKSINKVVVYRNIANKLAGNVGIDKVLIERIEDSLRGLSQYEELNKKDIDELIKAFEELQEKING